jgi:hypothetical protein
MVKKVVLLAAMMLSLASVMSVASASVEIPPPACYPSCPGGN